MVHVNWLAKDKWDQTYLSDLLDELSSYDSDRTVVVIPGAEYYERVDEVNEVLAQYSKVLAIVTSDEESLFDADDLSHPDMLIYSQYPTDEKSKNASLWLPIGYTPQARDYILNNNPPELEYEWAFSGQVNNDSRRKLVEKLRKNKRTGYLLETGGFTQGLPPDEYIKILASSQVAPSPWGIVVPEAFRTYEALELGVTPIAQGKEYHDKILDDTQFAHMDDNWEYLDYYLTNYVNRWPELNNLTQANWFLQKRSIKQRFMKDLGITQFPVTVIMSTSPIKTNPDTNVIMSAIKSAREQMPEAEILIMADGVRNEQEHLASNYAYFLRNLLWATRKLKDVYVIPYQEHLHQAKMTRYTLYKVNTPLVLFLEHDMLFNGRKIDWDGAINLVQSGDINFLRFHFENVIPEPHYYLMLDDKPITINGVPVIRTAQWSQRPHLAKVTEYQRIMDKFISKDANCMIEDALHGHIVDDCLMRKKWEDYKIAIYAPADGYEFAYHVDGRLGEDKFDEKQVF